MFKLIHGMADSYSDSAAFIERVRKLKRDKGLYFNKKETIFISRAPGRLDVMGGMADYSGATVFESTTKEATFCAVQIRHDNEVHIESLGIGDNDFHFNGQFLLSDLFISDKSVDYNNVHKKFNETSEKHWMTFPAGAFAVIAREKSFDFPGGANIFIQSNVPMGRGVSSSAALEISLLKAIIEAYRIPASHRDIPYWAHLLENNVVKSPCGMMDQYASSHGLKGHLLPIVCQPDTILDPVEVEEDITFVGVDTGIRSKLTKQNYAEVRVAAFMGYRIITDILGLNAIKRAGKKYEVDIDDHHFDGYLANMKTSRFDDQFRDNLPEQMSGKSFLSKYLGITDPIAIIEPDKKYHIKVACQNQVYENLRTILFLQLLRAYSESHDEQILISLGELMFLSHRSYTECGLGDSTITDFVRELRLAGPRVGIYGAKITGSGTGGTIAVLLKKTAMPVFKNMVEQFAIDKKTEAHMFSDNSPGAIEFDHLELKWFDS